MSVGDIAGFTTVFLSVTSLLLALIGNFWCNYAVTTLTLTSNALGNSTSIPLYYGIWNYRYTGVVYGTTNGESYAYSYQSCASYSGEYGSADTKWHSARAFTVLAVCLGGIGMFLSCAALGMPKFWKPASMLFLLTTLFQGLTFLFFQSNGCGAIPPLDEGTGSSAITASFSEVCGLAAASKLGISATVIWFVTALTALAAGKQDAEEDREVSDKQEDAAQPEEALKQEDAAQVSN